MKSCGEWQKWEGPIQLVQFNLTWNGRENIISEKSVKKKWILKKKKVSMWMCLGGEEKNIRSSFILP